MGGGREIFRRDFETLGATTKPPTEFRKFFFSQKRNVCLIDWRSLHNFHLLSFSFFLFFGLENWTIVEVKKKKKRLVILLLFFRENIFIVSLSIFRKCVTKCIKETHSTHTRIASCEEWPAKKLTSTVAMMEVLGLSFEYRDELDSDSWRWSTVPFRSCS